MSFNELTEKQISSEKIYDGKILHVYKDHATLPNGDKVVREYIRHVGAVCIVPVTDDGQVVIEHQYRYPIGRITLEIPAGKLDSIDEDPESAARRELKEETGAEAEELIFLGDFYPSPAYTDERIRMYMARGLTFGDSDLDDDEFLNVEFIPMDKLVSEIMDGNVCDGKTQAAVLKAYFKLQSK